MIENAKIYSWFLKYFLCTSDKGSNDYIYFLGAGNFGAVVHGKYQRNGETIPVAIKTLKHDDIWSTEVNIHSVQSHYNGIDPFNSLAPGKFEWNFRHVIFKQILVIDGWGICCEIAVIWMSLDLTDD